MTTAPAPLRLLLCVGPRCDADGRAHALLQEAERALAEKFPDECADGRLKIATRDCLRLCTRDPAARLEPSGEAFANPSIDDLLRLVAEALEEAESAADG